MNGDMCVDHLRWDWQIRILKEELRGAAFDFFRPFPFAASWLCVFRVYHIYSLMINAARIVISWWWIRRIVFFYINVDLESPFSFKYFISF